MSRSRLAASVGAAFVVAVIAASATGIAPLGVVLQGAILGTGTGLLGVGLVLVYRSARIVNFAYGSMGGLAAAVGVSLYLGHDVPWPFAVLVAIAVGIGVGYLVERLIIRRFIGSSRLTLTVATIGLAQVLGGLEFLTPRIVGGPGLVGSFPTALSSITVTVAPVIISGNDLLLLGAVPAVLAGLTWFLLRTEAGIAVRGVADNRERAQLLGIPVDKLSTVVWALVGALAAVTVMLKAPSEGLVLDVAAGPQLLLPALAAAVVAGMEDLPIAFAAGVGLGILDQLVRWNVKMQSTTSAVFLVVILVALMIKRRSAGRANTGEVWSSGQRLRLPSRIAHLPQVRITKYAGLGLLGVVALSLPLVASSSQLNRVSAGIVLAIVVVSIVMLTGWGGSVSLGQYAIAGIGGLVAANLVSRFHADLFLSLVAAAAAGAVIAVVIGLPGLRLNGLFLAVTTLAFAVMVDSFVLNPVNFGDTIPDSFDRPWLWSRFDLSDEHTFYFLCLAILAVSVLLVSRMRRARPGRVLLAGRDNERAASASGIPTTRTRLSAFVIAGILAGIAGGLEVVLVGSVGYHTFEPSRSLLLFSMAVIGGIESLGGALLGVALVQLAAYLFPDLQLVITGTGLLIVLLVMPRGLGELVERANIKLQIALAARQGIRVRTDVVRPGSIIASSADLTPAEAAPVAVAATASGKGMFESRGVTASYGPLQVLFGVDFVVEEGEMVALLGTNGAGKSTFLRCITGLLRPDAGVLRFGDADMRTLAPEDIAKKGIALMPGGRGLFASLTVAENLRLATWLLQHDPAAAKAERERVLTLLPVLRDRLDIRAGLLSGGEQQMLSMAMALATRPKLLCIDELSLGLAPTVVADLIDHVKRIHAEGTTVVLVEQSVNVALLLAERCVFLEKGEVVFSGPTQQLIDDPDVLRSVFVGGSGTGTTSLAATATRARDRGALVGPARADTSATLECREIHKTYGGITAVNRVSITVEPGSIVGIIGHNGAGKTTLFDLLTGFLVPDGGRVLLGGVDITDLPPNRRAVRGLGRSFQEALLYPSLTVSETVAVGLDMHLENRDPVAAVLRLDPALDSEAHAFDQVDELLGLLGLGAYHDRPTSELSTGTRRIVELACVLAQRPSVVLLDEPSAGVAQRDTEALGPLLRQVQAHTGCSLVVIEHDMNLMSGLCDRLVALELGTVIAEGTPTEVLEHPRVIASYLGSDEAVVARSGERPKAGAAAGSKPPTRITYF